MAAFFIKSFGGVNPKTPPRYLQDNQAQVAINCPVFAGSLVPLPDVSSSASATITKAGVPQTIYRYGQDVDSDSNYWFSWNFDVDVCRGQVSGDPNEWTFYTGDGSPKATYNSIALSGTNLPAASIPLGVPNPANAPDATPDPAFDSTADYPAEIVLDTVALANLNTSGAQISIDNGANYSPINLPSLPAANRQAYVAAQIDAIAGVTAVVDGLTVKITSDAVGDTASLIFRSVVSVSEPVIDETTAFTYTSGFDKNATGSQLDQPLCVIPATRWNVIGAGTQIRFKATYNSSAPSSMVKVLDAVAPSSFASASDFAAWINNNFLSGYAGALEATPYGTCVVVTPGTYGLSKTSPAVAGAIRFILGDNDSAEDKMVFAAARDSTGPARLIITAADYNTYLKGKYYSLVLNGGSETRASAGDAIQAFYPGVVSVIPLDPVEQTAYAVIGGYGTSSTIRLRSGTYGTTTTTAYSTLSAVGYTDTTSVPEARVYTYTWVAKIASFSFESGPSDPSTSVDVYKGQKVTVSNLETATSSGGKYYVTRNGITYEVTARRIYRSVNGVYLFVTELNASASSYVDELAADDLAEEMTVTGWSLPPSSLSGLINMPNGIMAGFTKTAANASGRDVYFCDPYHPHAWPEAYVQTVDYPIVGLGRMDTTLAVLTTGVPYFIQGSHPESMVVVKSDIQQSCASKRSIVSISGTVIYASPDGLVMLSSGGSRVLTDNMFTRAQWQTLNPSSIHAYQHDSKYIAFYDNGTVRGGFMFDLISGQFIFHDIYASAGYNDLLRDQLFLSFDDQTIKKWFDGSAKTYTWRSKLFTMPRVMGFACAQVEASSYPVTAKFYCDNSATPYFTQVVTSRNYFRLPVKQGRDFEVQLEGTSEVFSVGVSQAPEELADA